MDGTAAQRTCRPSRLSRGAALTFTMLVVVAAVAPMWVMEWYGNHDGLRYLLRLQFLSENLAVAKEHPRWVEQCANGLGQPYFNFYAPGFTYVCLLFLPLGLIPAVKTAVTLFTALAAFGSYAFGSRLGGRAGGTLAAVLVCLSPYPMFNLYIRGDLAEYAAVCCIPVILFMLWNSSRSSYRLRSLLLPAAAIGLFITLHNITALVTFAAFLVFGLSAGAAHGAGKAGLSRFAAMLVVSLLLSAWFWLPALMEKYTVQTHLLVADHYTYSNHHLGLGSYLKLHPLFNHTVGPGAVLSLLILSVLAAIRRVRSCVVLTLLLGSVVLLVLQLRFAAPVWDHAPLLNYLQFPWRLSGQATVALGLASAAIARRGALPPCRATRHLVSGTVIVALILGVTFASARGMRVRVVTVSDRTLSVHQAAIPDALTIGEFLPAGASPADAVQELASQAGQGVVTRDRVRTSTGLEFTIWAPESSEVLLPQLDYPVWSVVIAGRTTSHGTSKAGLITVAVPAGETKVGLRLHRTPVQRTSENLSLITWLAFAVLCAYALHTARRDGTPRSPL